MGKYGRVGLEITRMESEARGHRMDRENSFIRKHLGEDPDRLEWSSGRASQLERARKAAEQKGERFAE